MACDPSTLMTATVLGAAIAGSPVAVNYVRELRRKDDRSSD